MLESWTPLVITIVAACVFLYGASKTAMPVLGVLAGPVLAAVLTPTLASAFVVPLLLVGDLFALAYYRQHANWRLILKLIPGVLIGFVVTALMFRFLDAPTIGRFIGVLILVSLLLELWQRRADHRSDAEPEAVTHRGAIVFIPAVTIGALAGAFVFKRMNQKVFANVALALSGVAAAWLIMHG